MDCFPGDDDDARRGADMNLKVAFGGILTFKNARAPEIARKIPTDQIILETDCPFLAPTPFRGKRNQPLFVQYVYRKLAEIKEMDLSDLEKKIDKTAVDLFNLT